jgi:hypothetical protein
MATRRPSWRRIRGAQGFPLSMRLATGGEDGLFRRFEDKVKEIEKKRRQGMNPPLTS